MADRINAPIPPADLAKALDHLQQSRAILVPRLHPLRPPERQNILKWATSPLASCRS